MNYGKSSGQERDGGIVGGGALIEGGREDALKLTGMGSLETTLAGA
jgi:hypothetical protein